jgi:nicotinamidase-related amidase
VTPMTSDRAALLVMDIQEGIVARSVRDPQYMIRLSQAIVAARSAEIQVIYVKVAFRDGHPEVSARNRLFSSMPYLDQLAESTTASQIVPSDRSVTRGHHCDKATSQRVFGERPRDRSSRSPDRPAHIGRSHDQRGRLIDGEGGVGSRLSSHRSV